MKLTRILYASDLHGSDIFYRKILASATQYQANAIVIGGDVTGKAMIPVIHQSDGKYVGYIFGRKEEADSSEGLTKLKQNISNVGFYPIVLEPDEAAHLENNPAEMGKRFEQEMCTRVREWLSLFEEKLASKNIILYFLPGNDDLFSIDEIIEQYPHVRNPDMKKHWLDEDHEIVGLSNANMTPWKCNRDIEEDELEQKLNEIEKMLEHPERAVAVLHVPPYDSQIDVCPELDKDLKIVTAGGQVLTKNAGSISVKKFIQRVQPMLSLHGHIHEAAGHVRIGKTLAINAGSEYAEGIMKAAIINLEKDKVKGHLLISG
jgi:Icc-related predicted phosphoesterase